MSQQDTAPTLVDPTDLRSAAGPDDQAQDLVAQVGREISGALTSALERVNALTLSGRIDRTGLRALRDEIERARRAGMLGQQVCRLNSGRVQRSDEPVELTTMLRDLLSRRQREMQARGIAARQLLHPATVHTDATLAHTLLDGMVDWAFEHAVSRIDFGVEPTSWPPQARVWCHFTHRPADLADGPAAEGDPAARLQTMSWRLVQSCARLLNVECERHDSAVHTRLSLGFADPVTRADALDTLIDLNLDARPVGGENSKPLAGSHVLAIATRREVRAAIRDVIRPMGMMLDFVGSIDEAREFCRSGVPHAVLYESVLGGGYMRRLMDELKAEAPKLVFIEIGEQGRPFEVLHGGGRELARVARDALAEALPKALLFELAHGR